MAVSEKYILRKGHMVSPTRLIMHMEKCCVVFSLLLMAIFACGVIGEYLDLPQVDCGIEEGARNAREASENEQQSRALRKFREYPGRCESVKLYELLKVTRPSFFWGGTILL